MNTKMQTKKAKRGFTITELVIVIAVIAILAAVLIPTFSNVINRANESAAMQEARSEWSNFQPEVAERTADTNDFIIVYSNGATTPEYTCFEVVDGQFDPDESATTYNGTTLALAGTFAGGTPTNINEVAGLNEYKIANGTHIVAIFQITSQGN